MVLSKCPPCHVTYIGATILSNRVNTAFDPCTSRCREMCFANCIWLGKNRNSHIDQKGKILYANKNVIKKRTVSFLDTSESSWLKKQVWVWEWYRSGSRIKEVKKEEWNSSPVDFIEDFLQVVVISKLR